MMEKLRLTSLKRSAVFSLFLFLVATVSLSAQCTADAAAIQITGTTDTEATICVDGVGDPIDVELVGMGVGANNGWVITDNATGTILGLPPGPPFDLDGAGAGICDIWYLRYDGAITGLTVGQDVANVMGCFDLSNPITVTRNAPDAAAIQITGTTDTEATICVDGVGDPIDVELVGMGVGANNGWVITDNATGTILGLPPGPPFDLDGAGAGICDIWYLRYDGAITGLTVGQDVANVMGCFDLSNPITVTRNAPDAAAIQITGTTDTEATICVDGVGDPIDVELVGMGVGTNSGWVITDNATGTILGLPPGPPFDLDGAGAGVCDIWYLRYEDGTTGLTVGQDVANVMGCFDLSNPITVTRNAPDAAAIQIAGTTDTETSICVDGNGDPIDVELVGMGVGTNSGWVITDNATGTILGLPPGPPFDLDGAGAGVCDIWYLRYEDGTTGLVVGDNVADVEGCFDLSNPITVSREIADGGVVEIDPAATGNPNNTTSIAGDNLSAVICVDGRPDPIVVTHTTTAPNLTFRYVITASDADNTILAFAENSAIDLDGAGVGTCVIWGWSYRGLDQNDFLGLPLADLQAADCSDISDVGIDIIREAPDGGEVLVDIDATGNPNNTTTISPDGQSVVICVDGQADPLVVVHTTSAPNLTYRYVITDVSDTILAFAETNTIDLDGAGTGACKIWGWSYRGLDQTAFIGLPIADLDAEDCSDISDESILVVRQAADGGSVEVDVAATGNPNNTTSISSDGTEVVICVDGQPDPLVVSHLTSASFLSYRYVITNEDASEILAITPSSEINLDPAGVGTCQIWGWSYRGLADNGESFIGGPLADLDAVDCSDISNNAITVIREAADGGTVSLSNGDTEVTICAGDGIADPLDVVHENESPNLTYMYVITDSDADNTILAISPSSTIDLEGAGAGVCRIWGWSYRGLDQSTFIGMPLESLNIEDCSDVSVDFVEVTRLTGSECILAVDDVDLETNFSLFPNPSSSLVAVNYAGSETFSVQLNVFDITGRIVTQRSYNAQDGINLDVSTLSSGTYLVQITDASSGATITKRLLKE